MTISEAKRDLFNTYSVESDWFCGCGIGSENGKEFIYASVITGNKHKVPTTWKGFNVKVEEQSEHTKIQ
jgi:hypothetical protein